MLIFNKLEACLESSPCDSQYSLRLSSARLAAISAFVVKLRSVKMAVYLSIELEFLCVSLLKETIRLNNMSAFLECVNAFDLFIVRSNDARLFSTSNCFINVKNFES
jgi:hypothetical protein